MARLLLATRWSWAELEETPMEVVDAVIDELNAAAAKSGSGSGGEPRVEL